MKSLKKHIIIAYACEDSGSEPGVGFHWSRSIAEINPTKEIIIITRKNNDIGELAQLSNVKSIGIDIPESILFIKKIIGVRLYYLVWTFLVFFHLSKNFSTYRFSIIHHLTFTPIYYPPFYFLLPFQFYWGPIGGGEDFPISYLKNMKIKDQLSEIIRKVLKCSIFINPLFYLGCYRSKKIICSTKETANLIPEKFKTKIVIELMVMDKDRQDEKINEKNKTIIIANRLINWKMTHLFVDAFDSYTKDHKTDFDLLIIGNGPYFDKIQPFLKNKKIIHVNRFENRNDMLLALKNSSLFVSMSLRDSGAASLLEAASFGIPFLVTKSGAHKSFLSKEIGFGFMLSNYEKDVKKIEKILTSILSNANLLKDQSKLVKEYYNDYYSSTIKMERLKKIFSE